MFPARDNRTQSPGPCLAEMEHERLTDEAFQRYLEWRDECATLEAAYRNWSNAPASGCVFAFAAYTAALEREERAAAQYQALIDEGERLLASRGRGR
jgi:hypothetical protein